MASRKRTEQVARLGNAFAAPSPLPNLQDIEDEIDSRLDAPDPPHVRNTTRSARLDPIGMLAEMAGGVGPAIYAQEARGQRELAASEQLPAPKARAREVLEKAGVKWGAPTPGDDLFVSAVLPAGWKKRPTDHSMWTDLVDEKGRVRAQIFYKAAFYDRDASITVRPRFRVTTEYKDPTKDGSPQRHAVMDGKTVLFATAWLKHDADGQPAPGEKWDDWDARRPTTKSRVEAEAWLKEHYPNHDDPTAYWDLP